MALATFPNSINPACGHGIAGSVSKRIAARQPRITAGAPAFIVTVHGTQMTFGIDDDAFTAWVDNQGDELGGNLPDPSDSCPGSALSDLVYEALSAGALVGHPAIELNVHTDGAGYLVRLNNVAGCQPSVGLTRGFHEIHWPPVGLAYDECARYFLQEICDIANALLNDVLAFACNGFDLEV
ncbi:hypothetical protein MHAE_05622 [Mycobacterium haemophilum DSM 44634]|uniref:hypothetical protein n=1 Tax=Mycobacterium haemophilum TaxID=29311 RepID=UPI0006D5BD02|nr:hypothetical protein [Mycobacterium haemophilum]